MSERWNRWNQKKLILSSDQIDDGDVSHVTLATATRANCDIRRGRELAQYRTVIGRLGAALVARRRLRRVVSRFRKYV